MKDALHDYWKGDSFPLLISLPPVSHSLVLHKENPKTESPWPRPLQPSPDMQRPAYYSSVEHRRGRAEAALPPPSGPPSGPPSVSSSVSVSPFCACDCFSVVLFVVVVFVVVVVVVVVV